MKLTIVGMSGSFGGPASPASSYLIQATDTNGRLWSMVFDLGAGAFGALQNYVDPFEVDALAISHLHPDHCSDLSGYYVYYKYHPVNGTQYVPRKAIPSLAPSGAAYRFACAYGLEPGEDMSNEFEHVELADGLHYSIGPFDVEAFAVNHPIEAYGFRITGPSEADPSKKVVIAYSGDTDDCAGVRKLAQDADLFLAEAAFVEGRDDNIPSMHLTGKRAGAIAREHNAARLVLTHIPPWNDPAITLNEAREQFSDPLEVAQTGKVYSV